MTARTQTRNAPPRIPLRQTASWLALLATTTIGAQSSTLLAEVQLDASKRRPRNAPPQRLIVQVYPLAADAISATSRPSSSAQRAVTIDELRKGVAVHLVDVNSEPLRGANEPLTVIAWIEPGVPDLELDALNARPSERGPIGTVAVPRNAGSVRVQLHGDDLAA